MCTLTLSITRTLRPPHLQTHLDHEDGSSYYKIGTSNSFSISGEAPAYDYTIKLSATTINSGDDVDVSWSLNGSSAYTPCATANDWVAYYCGDNVESVSDSAYLDYSYVTDVASDACDVSKGFPLLSSPSANLLPLHLFSQTGAGEETLAISSGRLPECQFRMFASDGYTKVGQSAVISIADVASAVSHVHIALT